jgi:hypothetical protein
VYFLVKRADGGVEVQKLLLPQGWWCVSDDALR